MAYFVESGNVAPLFWLCCKRVPLSIFSYCLAVPPALLLDHLCSLHTFSILRWVQHILHHAGLLPCSTSHSPNGFLSNFIFSLHFLHWIPAKDWNSDVFIHWFLCLINLAMLLLHLEGKTTQLTCYLEAFFYICLLWRLFITHCHKTHSSALHSYNVSKLTARNEAHSPPCVARVPAVCKKCSGVLARCPRSLWLRLASRNLHTRTQGSLLISEYNNYRARRA